MAKQIVNPRVLMLNFVKDGDDWVLRIPDAFGKGKPFVAPVSENMLLQFQPVTMFRALTAEKVSGVACLPLLRVNADMKGGKPKWINAVSDSLDSKST